MHQIVNHIRQNPQHRLIPSSEPSLETRPKEPFGEYKSRVSSGTGTQWCEEFGPEEDKNNNKKNIMKNWIDLYSVHNKLLFIFNVVQFKRLNVETAPIMTFKNLFNNNVFCSKPNN